MTPIFRVTQCASLASFQDMGRRSCMQDGVAVGGVMDLHAHAWANRLLSKTINAATIEVTFGMFALEVLSDVRISLTGADLAASIDEKPIMPWQSYFLSKGSVLKFERPRSGVRAYIGIAAQIDLQHFYQSLSAVIKEEPLSLDAEKVLKQGQVISGKALSSSNHSNYVSVPNQFIPDYNSPLVLDLLSGYQIDDFDPTWLQRFLSRDFEILPSSNRMAYLLRPRESQDEAQTHNIEELASEGIAFGAVQIPPSGEPVILLNERQTIGGYPKAGCISRLSASDLAQRFAPSRVSFRLADFGQAQKRYREFLSFFSN